EVLGLVDHYGVVLLAVGQPRSKLAHQDRELLLPEGAVRTVPVGGAPLAAELVEGAHEGGTVAPVPGRHLSLEEGRQPQRVAEQCRALRSTTVASPGRLLGLLESEHGLAAAGAATHLYPVEQSGDVEDAPLLVGEPVRLGGTFLSLGDQVVLGVGAV